MTALNTVVEVGRLTKDPYITSNGKKRAAFNLAVDRMRKAQDQQEQQTADFIECVAFENMANYVEKWFHKGYLVVVKGHLNSYVRESNGGKEYKTNVVVEEANLLNRPQESAEQAPGHWVNKATRI